MHGEIRLPVAIEIQLAHHHTPGNGLFEDTGGDWFSIPQHQTR
jgi:hypothetical protein